MGIKLTFLGAAQNVTGSCYLVEADSSSVLIDCGMYQERDFKQRNWEPFPFQPASLDAVLLTHAHVDHCGLVPKLVKDGFKGRIYCTEATADIVQIVLLDSARIQREDAEHKKKRHEREGRKGPYPAVPLYTVEDVENSFALFESAKYGNAINVSPGIEVMFHDAGHILGSSSVELIIKQGNEQRSLLFSGDIGRWDTPLLCDPSVPDHAGYIVVESTYGNRDHKDNSHIDDTLEKIINETHKTKGKIIIPSFAIERTQELLYRLNGLFASDRIAHLPVFVDSPMAIRVTEVFRRHPELFDEETLALISKGDHPCDFPGLEMCRTVEESKAINKFDGPAIVIAGSGMCTGGRIKHHLANHIGNPDNVILFIGYQAIGTLGRIILEGADEVRIYGKKRPVRARVEKINGFSAHADRNELLRWLSDLKNVPGHVFVTHGEPDAANAFAAQIGAEKGWSVSVPSYRDTADLT